MSSPGTLEKAPVWGLGVLTAAPTLRQPLSASCLIRTGTRALLSVRGDGPVTLVGAELSEGPRGCQERQENEPVTGPAHLGCNYLIFLENQHHRDDE